LLPLVTDWSILCDVICDSALWWRIRAVNGEGRRRPATVGSRDDLFEKKPNYTVFEDVSDASFGDIIIEDRDQDTQTTSTSVCNMVI